MTLNDVFGFTSDDLAANRAGRFSANQLDQMQGLVKGVRGTLIRIAGLAIGGGFVLIIGMNLLFGDTSVTRILAIVIAAAIFIFLSFAGYVTVALSRTTGGARIGQVSGSLSLHIDDEGKLVVAIGGVSFNVTTNDPQIAHNLLEDGAEYTAYFMGNPPAAAILSLEQTRA